MGIVFGLAALATGAFTILPPDAILFRVYKAIPGFAMFRFPSRLLVLTAFFTALAAALGVDQLGRRTPSATLRGQSLVHTGALLVVLGLLVWPYRNTLAVVSTAGPELVAPDPRFFPPPTRPTSSYRVSVPGGRLDLRMGTFVRQGMRHHVRALQDYDPLTSRRLGTFLAAIGGIPAPTVDDFHPFAGALSAEPVVMRPRLFDLVAVQAVMLPADRVPAEGPPGWTLVARTGDLVTFRNERALPRAYVVRRARFVADQAAALDAITQDGFDGHGETVLVGSPGADAERALEAADAGPFVPATFVRDDPEHVVLSIAPEAPGVLVVADAFAPGWEATVDGTPRRLWQANHLVRGVVVGPGDRVVELRYHAPGFAAGIVACVSAWTVVLGGLVIARRRARRGLTREGSRQ
jgi:hypothetical protein